MGRLTAIVLGSAAGGGFPQWNCRCAVCRLAWEGDKRVQSRTQVGLAVSADRQSWTLLNAAPELRAQIAATPVLQPAHAAPHHVPSDPSSPRDLRASPIAAVVLTGAEIDQTAGLLNLRERGAFGLFATAETQASLNANPMFDVLDRELVPRRTVAPGVPFDLPGGLTAELFVVAGKVPLYLESGEPETQAETGVNVGIQVSAGGAKLAFIPGAAAPTPELMVRCANADVVLFDATLFADDEMIRSGTGIKTGRRMGHMPIDGAGGSLEALADLRARRVYIHINNTNPILVDGSPQRLRVEQAGWEVAYDGMEIAL